MILRNPLPAVLAAPKEMASGQFLMEAASVAAGFVLPNMAMQYVPATLRDQPWKGYLSKVAVVAGLGGVASMASKKIGKAILLGGGVSLLLDLYTDYVAPMLAPKTAATPPPAASSGVGAFYGFPGDPGSGMGTFFGGHGLEGVGDAMGASTIGG